LSIPFKALGGGDDFCFVDDDSTASMDSAVVGVHGFHESHPGHVLSTLDASIDLARRLLLLARLLFLCCSLFA